MGFSEARFQGRMNDKPDFKRFDPLPGQGGRGFIAVVARRGPWEAVLGPFYGPEGTPYARGDTTGRSRLSENPPER